MMALFGNIRFLTAILALSLPLAMGSPVGTESSGNSGLRYISGSVGEVVKSMEFEGNGVFSLGSDGVLRTFARDLKVIDYRQLDPEQVRELASKQAAQWEGDNSDVPVSILALSHSPVDGRLVTDIGQLTNPDEKPTLLGDGPESSKIRGVFEERANTATPHVCPSHTGCQSINDCTPHHCNACFFPHGPPHGTCFVS